MRDLDVTPPRADPALDSFPTWAAIALGLLLTVTLLLFELLPGGAPFMDQYGHLVRWDSYWYADIAVEGYHTGSPKDPPSALRHEPGQANVAFLPGYPLLARWLHQRTGISIEIALLLVAQAACWLLWIYIILLLRDWRVPLALSVAACLSIFSFPASFYLVAAYSESLFLAMILGIVYWQTRSSSLASALAVAHGFVMSATRMIGIPLALLPLVRPTPSGRKRVVLWRALASALMMMGGLSYLVFCAVQFGNWNVYMETERAGWRIVPDYAAILRLGTYQLDRFHWSLPNFPDLERQLVAVEAAWFLVLVLVELTAGRRRDPKGWEQRLGLYYAPACAYSLYVAGAVSVGMRSVIRFMVPIHVLLVLVTAHLLTRLRLRPVVLHAVVIGSCVVSLLLLRFHLDAATRFLRDDWVALMWLQQR